MAPSRPAATLAAPRAERPMAESAESAPALAPISAETAALIRAYAARVLAAKRASDDAPAPASAVARAERPVAEPLAPAPAPAAGNALAHAPITAETAALVREFAAQVVSRNAAARARRHRRAPPRQQRAPRWSWPLRPALAPPAASSWPPAWPPRSRRPPTRRWLRWTAPLQRPCRRTRGACWASRTTPISLQASRYHCPPD